MKKLITVTAYIIPVIIIFIIVYGICNAKEIYTPFVDGAAEGLKIITTILPNIIGILVAMSMLKASGAIELLANALAPALKLIGMPVDIIPLALLRPISGSGSLGLVSTIIKTHGPDSYTGRIASIMMGSTETIFYTIALYYGVAKIKNIRHTLTAALVADLTGVIGSILICRLFFAL